MPAAKQKRSKLAETSSNALPTASILGEVKTAACVLIVFMALLSFVESAPRAYRLKASNAAPHFSTKAGTSPRASDGSRRFGYFLLDCRCCALARGDLWHAGC